MCVQCVWSNMSIISRPLQPPTQDNDTAVCVCNVCGRICRSSVGLYSHQLKTTTLQYVCPMCVVGYVDHQSASTATNSFTENKLRGAAKEAKCWDMRRNKASMKNMKTPVYHMGERVLVRYKLPKHKVQKKTWALNGVVVDCRHGGHRYKISFNPSNWNALVQKWIHHNCSFLVNAVWTNWENDGHGSVHEIIWSDGPSSCQESTTNLLLGSILPLIHFTIIAVATIGSNTTFRADRRRWPTRMSMPTHFNDYVVGQSEQVPTVPVEEFVCLPSQELRVGGGHWQQLRLYYYINLFLFRTLY